MTDSTPSPAAILLPCPFCGGAAKCNGHPRGIMGQIYCGNDECFGPRTTALTKQDSIVQWNTRATLTAPDTAAGYKLVPIEPTRAMTMNACDYLPSCEHVFGHAGKLCADVWRKMLEAAPPPPAPPTEG